MKSRSRLRSNMADAAPCTCCHSRLPAPRDSAGCPADKEGFWRVLRCVELNPVHARLVHNAWTGLGRAPAPMLSESTIRACWTWKYGRSAVKVKPWKDFLREGVELQDQLEEIRGATPTGRPLGGEEFLIKLEQLTGKVLRRQKRDRKPATRLKKPK